MEVKQGITLIIQPSDRLVLVDSLHYAGPQQEAVEICLLPPLAGPALVLKLPVEVLVERRRLLDIGRTMREKPEIRARSRYLIFRARQNMVDHQGGQWNGQIGLGPYGVHRLPVGPVIGIGLPAQAVGLYALLVVDLQLIHAVKRIFEQVLLLLFR